MGALAAAEISALIQCAQIPSLRSDSREIIVFMNPASSIFLICSPTRPLEEILRAEFNNLYMSLPQTFSPRLRRKSHS
jgi:hypothetical protein